MSWRTLSQSVLPLRQSSGELDCFGGRRSDLSSHGVELQCSSPETSQSPPSPKESESLSLGLALSGMDDLFIQSLHSPQ